MRDNTASLVFFFSSLSFSLVILEKDKTSYSVCADRVGSTSDYCHLNANMTVVQLRENTSQ